MADTKITALAAIATVDPAADVLPIVDISDTSMAASGTTKKVTSNQILGAGGTATLASATITGDLTVDTSTLKVDSTANSVGIGTASPTTNTLTIGASRFILCSDSQSKFGDSGIINGGAADANTQIQYFATKALIFSEGASNTKMTLNSTGLNIANGNVILGTSGKGIDFSATANSSGTMTSELLNDYEEGTFTPTMTASVGTLTTTTVNAASYTKIGRLVSVQVDISIVNIGTASGQLFFSLPFSQGTDINVGVLRELGATGNNGQISYQSATTAYACFFGNGTLIVNGYRIRGTYTYTV